MDRNEDRFVRPLVDPNRPHLRARAREASVYRRGARGRLQAVRLASGSLLAVRVAARGRAGSAV
jgi:hypothetical protein